MMSYTPTPLAILPHPAFKQAGVEVIVKREDLNHPQISGNKWWKLKYNLLKAASHHETILTFGGAYSNHIYATAAAAQCYKLKSIGVIRGERTTPLNKTLQFAEEQGMRLHFVSRETYQRKTDPDFIEELHRLFGAFYTIPEGGSNALAVKGCEEFARLHLSTLSFDELFVPVGTGGTMAGLISAFQGNKIIKGISVLKNGEFLNDDVRSQLEKYSSPVYGNWEILTSYHHGGYAKVTDQLKRFIVMMNNRYNLPLDPVYTGKLLWAAIQEAETGNFKRGTTIMILHTGGLQGCGVL